ncbi:MAG: tRNA (adenosine(37)-N6)-threonylcarbamoyltransferase complex dimerization subunit type 1 TsaB [Actinomycetota bacterium]|nr:tRNA (adenosine(37)-N6)-threonylcarbamoyltransferase complex dimerization subunit type 1 TsaB [Actinomycetota bacterium]
MLLLALDTATPAVTVALTEVTGEPGAPQVQVLATFDVVDARRHGELVAAGVAQVLERAGRAAGQLDAVAVGLGPGPFTGLRVGIMTAAALADALGVPAYGRCSLDVLGWNTTGSRIVATDARRREVYWAAYTDGVRTQGPFVSRPAEVPVSGRPVLGSATALYPDLLPGEHGYPTGAALARLVAPAVLRGDFPEPLIPLYLRRPDAVPQPARQHPAGTASGTAPVTASGTAPVTASGTAPARTAGTATAG